MSNPLNIAKTVFSDPINKWIFSTASTDIFLVGGYVRDILRGVISSDKDYALKGNVEDIAAKTAKRFNGTLIPLKPPTTYRVVLRNKDVLDFSYLQGSIDEDLKKRDFTINAMAWSPKTGIIDPFEGQSDLNNKIIKAVRMKNLLNDPLRILRAYRLASELSFKIEQETKESLKRYARVLPVVASERITEEFFKILKNKNATKYLNECYKDEVLERIFKSSQLASNIKLLSKLDLFLKKLSPKISKSLHFEDEISQGLSRMGLIRLVLLLMNKKDIALKERRLRVSRNIQKALENIHTGYAIALNEKLADEKFPQEKLFKIFKTAEDNIFEVCIVLSLMLELKATELFKRAHEYIKTRNKILLNGDEIQSLLNLPPGNKIGRILSALQEAQFKGYIKTSAEAKKWVLANFT